MLCQPRQIPVQSVSEDRGFTATAELGPMICVRRSPQAYESLLFCCKVWYAMTTNLDSQHNKKTDIVLEYDCGRQCAKHGVGLLSKKPRCITWPLSVHRSVWVHYTQWPKCNPATRPENLLHRSPSSDERVDCRRSIYR